MELTHSIFRCTVFHGRTKPVKSNFTYRYFMFQIDLDKLDCLESFMLSASGRARAYTFAAKDHYHVAGMDTRGSIDDYLNKNGFDRPHRLTLLTNLRTFGYQFNPVSFYFAYYNNVLKACIAEVGNTFGEQKLFLLKPDDNGRFHTTHTKHFYVSPFSDPDADFEFTIRNRNGLEILINTISNGEAVLYSRLSGNFESLTNLNLIRKTFRFPLVTIKVISMIHWQAFKVWLKKAPFSKKAENIHLQKDHYKIKR